MAKHFRYYLGRITKGGVLTTEELIEAILDPRVIKKNNYSYTFANMEYNKEKNYIYGKLVKFLPEGEVETIEPDKHQETSILIPHKKESSSPFILLLDYMGIAYPTVWNNLLKEQFERYFCELIEAKYDSYFVSCTIEPIVDLRTFVERIAYLDRVEKIKATVVPPNPLFGSAWKDLKEYMEKRKTGEVTISEKSKNMDGIHTKIIGIMKKYVEKFASEEKEEVTIEDQQYDIGDAAILMAADGYGNAKIEGTADSEKVIIRTKDNQKSFLYDKEPDSEEFYEFVLEEFKNINNERYLRH